MDLTDTQRGQISAEIELLSREALDKLGLSGSGFLVVVNGGQRQDVRQVHFHLLTEGYEIARTPSDLKSGIWTDVLDPSCEIHQVRTGQQPVLAALNHAVEHRDILQLDRRGYSIVLDARTREDDLVVHLTAGTRG